MPLAILGKSKDLGDGFNVLRVLPQIDARAVGPFVFFDHFGPHPIKTGGEMSVRPHPHIGLATVTYLYDGVVLHKDSLGSEELIRPGAVNWMTAGRGIVHSEHSRLEANAPFNEGIQTWVALPIEHEETPPTFEHYAAEVLPAFSGDGFRLRVVAGTLMGKTSPVKTFSPLYYGDLEIKAGVKMHLDLPRGQEAALYVARGTVTAGDLATKSGTMLVFSEGETLEVSAGADARIVVLGGEKLKEPRYLWWNFVATSKERIERAKAEWRANTMGIVRGENDRIPLPEDQH
ncbi:MAG: pirin family protein [Spirochaetes bacterium]|nr:pirin family protein [Spirochaetota bacterium]